jgi:hypothetical protein
LSGIKIPKSKIPNHKFHGPAVHLEFSLLLGFMIFLFEILNLGGKGRAFLAVALPEQTINRVSAKTRRNDFGNTKKNSTFGKQPTNLRPEHSLTDNLTLPEIYILEQLMR